MADQEVIIGYDGRPRCSWVGAGDTALGRYHDEVWGTRTYDDSSLFEALTLGVFEAGLSWSIVFRKWQAAAAAENAEHPSPARGRDRLAAESSGQRPAG
jgi:DNA-3-methyladenine glycosylase I